MNHPDVPSRRGFLRGRSLRALGVCGCAALTLAMAVASDAGAQVLRKELPQLDGVGIVEHRGARIPQELVFKDGDGRDVRLAELFDGERPVLLVMAYYDCPLLCTLVLNDVQRCLNELSWTAGREFRMVTISFSHRDTPAMARSMQNTYLAGYARDVEDKDDAWLFLTGDVENIRALSTAVGFHYRYLPESGEYSHPAAMIVITADGTIHNYIENMVFTAPQVKQALLEAAEGRIGSIFDRISHFCFSYDFTSGKHSPRVVRFMQIGAGGTFAGLAIFVGYVGMSRSRRTRQENLHSLQSAGDSGQAPGGDANS